MDDDGGMNDNGGDDHANDNDRGDEGDDVGFVSDTGGNDDDHCCSDAVDDGPSQQQQQQQMMQYQYQQQQANMYSYHQSQNHEIDPTMAGGHIPSQPQQAQQQNQHFQFDNAQYQQQQHLSHFPVVGPQALHPAFSPPQQQQQQQQENQQQGSAFPSPPGPPSGPTGPQPPHQFPAGHPGLLQFYEAQMRGHAAAYANAAAGAAMAAAQIAVGMVSSPNLMASAQLAEQPPQQQQPQQLQLNGGAPPSLQMPTVLPSPPEFFPPPSPAMSVAMSYQLPEAGGMYGGPGMMSHAANYNGPCYSFPEDVDSERPIGGGGRRRAGTKRTAIRRKTHRRDPSSQSMIDSMSLSSGSNYADEYSPKYDSAYDHGRDEYQQQQFRHHPNSSGKRGRRRSRRSWNEATSSDDSGRGAAVGGTDSSMANNRGSGTKNHISRKQLSERKIAFRPSSSSDGSSASIMAKKKQRKVFPGDSLLGKTASMVLHELCAKRKDDRPIFAINEVSMNRDRVGERDTPGKGEKDPNIRCMFEASVSVNGVYIATGYGVQKSQAKHDASVRALHYLFPGVEFENGLLTKIPEIVVESATSVVPSKVIDQEILQVANSMASGLSRAASTTAPTDNSLMSLVEQQLAIGRGDGDDTSSDEESYNDFQNSADKWETTLLYQLVQLDPRFEGAPICTYTSKGRAKAAASTARCRHQCSVQLKVLVAPDRSPENTVFGKDYLLKSQGLGYSKRSAKHSADVKMLQLLFPHCSGMKEVKAAAESAIAKQKKEYCSLERNGALQTSQFKFETALGSTQNLPDYLETRMQVIFGQAADSRQVRNQPMKRRAEDDSLVTDVDNRSTMIASRRQQLEEKVNAALQKLKDHDEEGRLRLSDDVGTTILRTAQIPGDVHWLQSLLKKPFTKGNLADQFHRSTFGHEKDTVPGMTIALLLCRAIAPYDDPPLGCAVLSIGFSLQKGKLLRIADISSEDHLPKERFLECLESFASCMGCVLEHSNTPPQVSPAKPNSEESNDVVYQSADLQHVFHDYLKPRTNDDDEHDGTHQEEEESTTKTVPRPSQMFQPFSSTYERPRQLESVKEVIEEEEIDRSKKRSKSNND